ncbi:hypothetical protein BX616_001776 [Lobosporangium transversale]|uniref:Uncharacterized protein n=1 Tax=Lobosporangium transversale TaxID=64571 RepID=A0A1Y2GYP4_9FUNG|nr:hypothetical protein BCR41DRAFT_346756 [Lobosporangium transversale]KAF9902896.1 hypothetical protein BX616_001776 [Lobosporangium transversale]ORZ27419.1 hypothetical protein BCR41DRAFT_346756 [Lobosporangium transversale]|eukprot:XP_021885146.1 hypothetical protein BCR41DRAFT_346756 [Lobosporangium transversale]
MKGPQNSNDTIHDTSDIPAPQPPSIQSTAPSSAPPSTSLYSPFTFTVDQTSSAALLSPFSTVSTSAITSSSSPPSLALLSPTETAPYDDAPPSYEATIDKDNLPQIHNDYDHLCGPPSQRGVELKGRIPMESLNASLYNQQSSTAESSGAVGTSSASSSSGPRIFSPAPPRPNESNYVPIQHSPTTANAPELGLRGQISLDDEEEGDFANDMDRLLGTNHDNDQDYSHNATTNGEAEEETGSSSWSIAGDGRAWAALTYMIFMILPWSVFCFTWTFIWALMAFCLMIIPPLGYPFVIFSATSWRALARVDLALSAALVSNKVRQKYPNVPARIFIASEPDPRPPSWKPPSLFGIQIPLPQFILQRLERRHTSRHWGSLRRQRYKNMWDRGAKHLKATMDRHTYRSMVYFMFWKLMLASMLTCFIWLLFLMTLPMLMCLMPTLLVVSRKFANWQYRWAVYWLSEKPAPIVV